MARGRMINNDITKDRKIHMLSDDTSRLAFTWLITFADCEGRTYGDPAIVRSMIFPRREDISIVQMEGYIKEWAKLGLVIWYEVNEELYISFPAFDRNQPGLRKDREPASEFPIPPTEEECRIITGSHPDDCRTPSGTLTEEYPVKLREVKLREVNANNDCEKQKKPSAMEIFCNVTGMVSIPSSEIQKTLPALEALILKHPDGLTEYLQRFYLEWQKRRTKDGRKYSKTNCTWLYDWAVAGEIPAITQNGAGKNDDGSLNL